MRITARRLTFRSGPHGVQMNDPGDPPTTTTTTAITGVSRPISGSLFALLNKGDE